MKPSALFKAAASCALALALALCFMPMAASADETAEVGTIQALDNSGNVIVNGGGANVSGDTVTFTNYTFPFVSANPDESRTSDGYWAGVKVTAPVNAATTAAIVFGGKTYQLSAIKDSGDEIPAYTCLWKRITPGKDNDFSIDADWNGDGQVDQTFDVVISDSVKFGPVSDDHAHVYDTAPVWAWSSDMKSATATFTCSIDNAKTTVNATVSSKTEGADTVYTATVTFNDDVYTDEESVPNPPSSADAPQLTGKWVKDSTGWWYQDDENGWPRSQWATIDGKKYHFNKSGYMDENWLKDGGDWYWLGSDGAMKTGWQKVNGTWYLMNSDGVMETGMQDDGGNVYYLSESGAMQTGWVKIGSVWYYFNGSGAMVENSWIGNYYVGSDGVMATDTWVDGKYYVNADGLWKRGWVKVGSDWYYDAGSGMVKNSWIGNYYVGSDGVMATDAWVDGKYYVNADGLWKRGWVKVDSYWYYDAGSGMVKNSWVGDYWLGSNGQMATNAWVDNNKYYVDPAGVWMSGWALIDGSWYYFRNSGKATNEWIDGIYYVDADGIWDDTKEVS